MGAHSWSTKIIEIFNLANFNYVKKIWWEEYKHDKDRKFEEFGILKSQNPSIAIWYNVIFIKIQIKHQHTQNSKTVKKYLSCLP